MYKTWYTNELVCFWSLFFFLSFFFGFFLWEFPYVTSWMAADVRWWSGLRLSKHLPSICPVKRSPLPTCCFSVLSFSYRIIWWTMYLLNYTMLRFVRVLFCPARPASPWLLQKRSPTLSLWRPPSVLQTQEKLHLWPSNTRRPTTPRRRFAFCSYLWPHLVKEVQSQSLSYNINQYLLLVKCVGQTQTKLCEMCPWMHIVFINW